MSSDREISEQQLKLRRIEAFISTYDETLDALEIPPNGDDYNDIVRGVWSILAGGVVPKIDITTKGR